MDKTLTLHGLVPGHWFEFEKKTGGGLNIRSKRRTYKPGPTNTSPPTPVDEQDDFISFDADQSKILEKWLNEINGREITLVRMDEDPTEAYVNRIILTGNDTTRPQEMDIETAIKAAANEYLHTPEGRKYLDGENGCFNYGDAIHAIPDEITTKHGYKIIESEDAVIVDHNEHLVPPDLEEP